MEVMLKALSDDRYRLKKPVAIEIEDLGGGQLKGRFRDLILLLEAEEDTPEKILAALEEGLLVQYEISNERNEEMHRIISAGISEYLEPVAATV